MRKLLGLAILAVGVLAPAAAEARGYGRGGTVMTPFGAVNMNSPAYRMAGGDPFLAVELQQEMNMMKVQQQYMQQQMKLQQQFQQRMKNDPNFRKQVEAQQAQMKAAYEKAMQPKKKKKRPTFHGSTETANNRHDDKTASAEKDAATTAGASSNSALKSRRDDKPAEAKPSK